MNRNLMPSYGMTHVHTTNMKAAIPEDQLPIMTLDEVRQHNTRKDAWIVINGDVFDVTTYSRSHPGGPSIFGSLDNTDSTSCFRIHHRSQRATDRAKSLRIGRLSPEDWAALQKEEADRMKAENERIVAEANKRRQ